MKLNAMITNYSDVMDKLKIEWGVNVLEIKWGVNIVEIPRK